MTETPERCPSRYTDTELNEHFQCELPVAHKGTHESGDWLWKDAAADDTPAPSSPQPRRCINCDVREDATTSYSVCAGVPSHFPKHQFEGEVSQQPVAESEASVRELELNKLLTEYRRAYPRWQRGDESAIAFMWDKLATFAESRERAGMARAAQMVLNSCYWQGCSCEHAHYLGQDALASAIRAAMSATEVKEK